MNGPFPVSTILQNSAYNVCKIVVCHADLQNWAAKHCISDRNYSYNQCLRKYVFDHSSCNIDLINNEFDCTENGLKLFYNTLIELRSSTRKNITKTTGCFPKCVTSKYSFELKETEKAEWKRDWISAFYLSSETTTYEKSIESYSYDEQVNKHLTLRSRERKTL